MLAVETSEPAPVEAGASPVAEGAVVESPLVGVAYLSPAPDKPAFVAVGDTVKRPDPHDYRSHEGHERSAC